MHVRRHAAPNSVRSPAGFLESLERTGGGVCRGRPPRPDVGPQLAVRSRQCFSSGDSLRIFCAAAGHTHVSQNTRSCTVQGCLKALLRRSQAQASLIPHM